MIGGYTKIERNVIQGSKFIEIFELRKLDIETSSQIIKLSIGRISPIIMTVNHKSEIKILIMGGNSTATINSKDVINFDYEHQTNESTNQSATSLPSQ